MIEPRLILLLDSRFFACLVRAVAVYPNQSIYQIVEADLFLLYSGRWHLAVQGKNGGRLYLWNGAALCISFLVIRVLAYALGMAHLWQLRLHWAGPGAPALHQVVVYLLAGGWLLNCYWMLAIMRGTIRALRRSTASKSE